MPEAAADSSPSIATLARKPNVLPVTIDTLRADHVGAYGYRGEHRQLRRAHSMAKQ